MRLLEYDSEVPGLGSGFNIGALIIRIRCWGIVYSSYNKDPHSSYIREWSLGVVGWGFG